MLRISAPEALPAFPEAASLSDLRAEGIAGQRVRCRYCGRVFPSSAPLCTCSQDTLVLANPMIGRVLGGRYRFDELLAGPIFAGGVYRCSQLVGEREVVIRLMRPGAAQSAAAAARVKHPAFPRVVEVGRGERFDFVATERVAGATFDELIAARRRMSPLLAARLAVQALHALSAAHAAGVIHGRVHPRNVVLRERGTLALLDLGVGPRDLSDQTPGQRLHSLAYTPPEYRKGAMARTASADVWGLSRMLLELLLGRRLGLEHPGFDYPAEGSALVRAFKRGMARDPALRFTNARSLLEEIAAEVIALDLSAPDDALTERIRLLRPKKRDWMVDFLEKRWLASREG